jgi:hypothetical protein
VARPDRLERLRLLPLADCPALAPPVRRQRQLVWPESHPASAAHCLAAVVKARDLAEMTVPSQRQAQALVPGTAAPCRVAAWAQESSVRVSRPREEVMSARPAAWAPVAVAVAWLDALVRLVVSGIASPRRAAAWAQESSVRVSRPREEVMSARHAA